ncbi:class I SAM-dependent methyltransferase [Methyloceanibacter sp. wino2]|uniref:class I SAM-dependent methyltransferase n=1 Tax=Methyloceanibacter sp. wino2 TaxID=2170729 RepID=UPI00131F2233|nr:class I SAM-dependent methyltransferase [Methyloceanibacter sp. wino2]
MLDQLPKNGVVMEVGTQRGDFARAILERATPRELRLVDINYSLFDDKDLTGDAVTRHCGMSHEVIGSFPDEHFDWIYIDADHSYEATLRDACASAPKLKPGGFLVFNDFAHIDSELGRYGVHRAVTNFALERNWRFALFAFSPDALYDVALQKGGA